MNRIIFGAISLIIAFLFSSKTILSQTWIQRAPAPSARWNPASVVLDGTIFVIGGQDSSRPYTALKKVEAYDPVSDSWEIKAPMLTGRWGLVTAVVNDKIYAIGGRGGSFLGGHYAVDVVEEYDPLTDTWTVRTSMPTPRGWMGSAVINDTIYVFGGLGAQSDVAVVEKYHPVTDSWTSEADMPQPRSTFMTATLNNRIYLIGGWSSKLVQEYDPKTKIWTTKTSMPTARGGSGIDVCQDRIWVIGGRGGKSNELESYEPIHDRWSKWIPMPMPREGLTAGAINGKLYAIMGSVPLAAGGLPYYSLNEEASNFIKPLFNFKQLQIDDSQGNNNGHFNTGETVNLIITVENIGYPATNVKAELVITDENITEQSKLSDFGDIQPFEEATNSSNPFILTAKTNFPAQFTPAKLIVMANDNYVDTLIFEFTLGDPQLLLIDDDDGMSYEQYYLSYLSVMREVCCHWDTKAKGLPSFQLSEYKTVIWFTGDDRDSTLTPQDQSLLIDYINQGGNLILTGQNIGYDLAARGSPGDSLFYTTYLHAELLADSCISTYIRGITDDPIGKGKILSFIGNFGAHNQNSPSIIKPIAPAEACITYLPPTLGAAAIRFSNATSKLVYFAFGLEGIAGPTETAAIELLSNTLTWISNPIDVQSKNLANIEDLSYRLFQNTPNPFNSNTQIRYVLPENAFISIKVFDLLGREMRTLLNCNQQTGIHQINWDGSDKRGKPLSSGIYFVTMKANHFIQNIKLLLLR